MALNQGKSMGAGLLFLFITSGVSSTFRELFVEALGFWGGVVGGTLVASIIIFGVCLAFKFDWRRSLALAAGFPLTLNAIDVTKELTEPSIGGYSIIAGIAVAAILGLSTMAGLTWVLGINWEDDDSTS